MFMRRSFHCSTVLLLALAAGAMGQVTTTLRPGPLEDGPTLLPTGWPIRPAGRQVELGEMPQDMAISPNGQYLLVLNGGANASVSVMDAAQLVELSRVSLPAAGLGLTFSQAGGEVYVAGGRAGVVYALSFSRDGELAMSKTLGSPVEPGPEDFIGDVAVPPNGRLVYATDVLRDRIMVLNPVSGEKVGDFATGRRPRKLLFHPDGKALFVASWADATILQHEANTGRELSRLRVASHPTDMVLSRRKVPGATRDFQYRIFVPAANTNDVVTVEIDADRVMHDGDVLNVGFASGMPAGMTPLAVAISPSETALFIACADANVIAVADITEERGRLAGFIPTGEYPTGVRMMADGRLAILNGDGSGDGMGTMSVVNTPTAQTLSAYTDESLALLPYEGGGETGGNFPIEHVIYVITDGHPADAATPNYGQLAEQFVRLTNFHAGTSRAMEGVEWLLAGISPNFTRLLAPKFDGGKGPNAPNSLFGVAEPANQPPAGYLWTNAAEAGRLVRNYGAFTADPLNDLQVQITSTDYPGPDPSIADTARVRNFLNEFNRFAEDDTAPDLMLVRLAGDGDAATLADHDAAIGMLVEGISRSRLWPTTAIVIAPASSSNESGDASAFFLSAYTHRAESDDTLYTQPALLRTVERLLGIRPITLFDAASIDLSSLIGTIDTEPFASN